MSFAQHHYPFENKEIFEKQFPAQFISEAVDQTRGWFYSLLAISTLLFNKAPYENVIVLGLVQDENGQKMSKSKGNAVDPFDALQTCLRDTVICQVVIYCFYSGFQTGQQPFIHNSQLVILQTVFCCIEVVDVCWYVRRSRERFWAKGMEQDKINAYMTLYTALVIVAKAAAPMIPFMTEDIYQNLVRSINADAPGKYPFCATSRRFTRTGSIRRWKRIWQICWRSSLWDVPQEIPPISKNRQPIGTMYVKSEFQLSEFYKENQSRTS